MNKINFVKMMTVAGETFDKKITDALLDIYFEALKKYSDDQITHAYNRAITELKFFPKPAELIEFITGGTSTTVDRAELAWVAVDKAVRAHGHYASVRFDDPAIHLTIEGLGGWHEFQRVPTSEDWKWVKVGFCKLYQSMLKSGNIAPTHLSGAAEIEQLATGNVDLVHKPVFIKTGLEMLNQGSRPQLGTAYFKQNIITLAKTEGN